MHDPARGGAIAAVTHNRERLLAVATIDAVGEELDLLATAIGDYRGAVLFDVEAGSH